MAHNIVNSDHVEKVTEYKLWIKKSIDHQFFKLPYFNLIRELVSCDCNLPLS